MRSGTTMGVVALTGALALGACGGTGGGQSSPNQSKLGRTGSGQDPDAVGPVTISGAQKGGTVTVLTLTGLTTTIDPSEIYYTDTSSIMSGLVDPVADAVQVRPDDQADDPGPRPGHRPRSPTTTTTPSGSSRSAPA